MGFQVSIPAPDNFSCWLVEKDHIHVIPRYQQMVVYDEFVLEENSELILEEYSELVIL